MKLNKRPVSYLQTDSRWKNVRLKCVGGTMSIGGGGCGPTSAAMLIETLTGKTCLPTETMQWACDHGYVYAEQGTDYGCFKPLFKAYGIDCDILTWEKCLNKNSPVRQKAIQKLMDGYYLIALMKPKADGSRGTWTAGGHYIVVWWADDKIRINDPASTANKRLNGDPDTFFSEAKYFWWVDAREYNNPKPKEEDEDMTLDTYKSLYGEMRKEWQDNDASSWSEQAREWAVKTGLIQGGGTLPNGEPNYMWQDTLSREQLCVLLYRFAQMMGKT